MSNLNETIIRETFGQAYNRDKFTRFTRELLTGIQEQGTTHVQIPTQFKDYIQSYYRVGKYVYNDGFEKIIDVLEVKLKKNSSIEHARAMQRNFVARYLNGAFGDIKRDAALVAFISEDTKDWRFSFVKMDYKSQIITLENGKQKRIIEKELTPAKRFSFLVGENEYIHTAQKQLFNCLGKASSGKQITLEDLVEAFDIEKVSKEFFDEYKKLYIRLRDELKRIYDFDKKIHKDFDEHNINIDDFAKKTLGQLVFLYFVQRKGWLGVKSGEQWGSGDKRFLRNLFDKKYVKYDNFFNDILEPLFYRALARDRGNENDNFAPLNCRIPFLNGGLFEPINGYGYAQTDLTIDNAVFKEIFGIFDLYNFTVKEDEPLEKEVAIDPEMLGKVFENLLPENERKGNGAFYTPREIVHYMCQESLINYLYNAVNTQKLTPSEAKQDVLFAKKKVKQTDLELEKFEEIVSKEDISTFIKLGESTYTNSNRGINEDLPSSIKENAVKINQALKDVKICDPAIGSGAFPVGMMNEIVRARLALGVENKTTYQIKREIIENNLYGVDLDDGAVEIAKLRFWLSLIVDEEDVSNIKPLPNLDYKVMQGNSLISSYEGIDFDEIVENYKPKAVQLDFDYYGSSSDNIIKNINSDMYAYIKASHDTEKQEIRNKIEQRIVELIKNKVEEKARQGGIKWENAEQTIRDFAQNNKHRNFFPWKLFFADVFMNGGFDIVIGNPPYLEARSPDYTEKMKINNLNATKNRWGNNAKHFTKGCDLLIFFFELSLYILKKNGINAFITQNSWLDTDYGKKFQDFLMVNTEILGIIDSDYKYFDAKEGPNINTIISFFSGKENKTKELPFACYHINFETSSVSLSKLSAIQDSSLITYKKYDLNQYKGIKWGILLYSTDSFLKILNILKKKGSERNLKIGQGLNLSKSIIAHTNDLLKLNIPKKAWIPFFTKRACFNIEDTDTWLVDCNKLEGEEINYIKSCKIETYNFLHTTKNPPILILPRGLGRHFCALNAIKSYSDSYVDIYDDDCLLSKEDILNLWCFLNSSILWLIREIAGRKNLGGGMLKAEATDLKAFPLLFNFNKNDEILKVYEKIKTREVLDTINEIDTNEHKLIDEIVFNHLELNDYDRNFVINELKNKIKNRSAKSRT